MSNASRGNSAIQGPPRPAASASSANASDVVCTATSGESERCASRKAARFRPTEVIIRLPPSRIPVCDLLHAQDVSDWLSIVDRE